MCSAGWRVRGCGSRTCQAGLAHNASVCCCSAWGGVVSVSPTCAHKGSQRWRPSEQGLTVFSCEASCGAWRAEWGKENRENLLQGGASESLILEGVCVWKCPLASVLCCTVAFCFAPLPPLPTVKPVCFVCLSAIPCVVCSGMIWRG